MTDEYLRLAVYLGTAVLLLRVVQLLVLVPVLEGRELSAAQARILSTAAQVSLVVFALAGGFDVLAAQLQVEDIQTSAREFVLTHQRWVVEAAVQVSVLQSSAGVAARLPPLGVVWSVLDVIRARLFDAAEVISVVLVLLEFGERYAMSTLFPAGVIMLILPGLRYAGGFLTGVAVLFWLTVPAVLTGAVAPLARLMGADAGPPPSLLLALLPILASLFPALLGAAISPPVAGTVPVLWAEFFGWYARETALWLEIVPSMLGFAGLFTLVISVYVVGGGRVASLMRLLVRYLLPLRNIR